MQSRQCFNPSMTYAFYYDAEAERSQASNYLGHPDECMSCSRSLLYTVCSVNNEEQ